jgi:hypothetical protein
VFSTIGFCGLQLSMPLRRGLRVEDIGHSISRIVGGGIESLPSISKPACRMTWHFNNLFV